MIHHLSTSRRRLLPLLCTLGCLASLCPGRNSNGQSNSTPEAVVVIPFDFESKFDDGRYGRMVGDMIWQKLNRRGKFIIPETMLDVRDWSKGQGIVLNPDTPLEQVAKIIRDDFGAQIGIWGKVERLPHVDWDQYDLWILVVDFSGDRPRPIARIKARTKTVSEIPHRYVQEALDKLYGVSAGNHEAAPTAERDALWKTNPNLVQGDFESAAGWDPPSEHVRRTTEAGSDNHILRFEIPKDVAATTGVLYYSQYFPIQERARYRFQCRWRSSGSAVKVFIKCYDEMTTRFEQRGGAKTATAERREVYRSQQNLKGKSGQWHVHTEEFTPRHTQFSPRWGRVMLYGYWPQGTVEWDDVVLKLVEPPPPSSPKIRRPSLETKVRSDEIGRTPNRKREHAP